MPRPQLAATTAVSTIEKLIFRGCIQASAMYFLAALPECQLSETSRKHSFSSCFKSIHG